MQHDLMTDDDEINVIIYPNKDSTEILVVFKRKKTISNEEFCMELEFLAHETDRANRQRNKPGVHLH